ncbi:NAD-dependent epimerase/dehydratase family protein [Candidatus Micrarchaeota archaeon]|nr:NAD-dependent epimerase/dehydratase family protein [Candidatus Micrarchaeota archaeon]
MVSPLSKPRVLLTGGAGFIGRHVAAAFESTHDVRILDLAASGPDRGDVSNERDVARAMHGGVDCVIHLAALASVQKSLQEPETARRWNVDGTRIVLEQALAAGVRSVVFASSCAVYGDAAPPLQEDVPVSPLSLYAETKVAGEQLCRAFSQRGLNACVLRLFNVYGAGQRPDSDYAAVIPAFLHAARAGRPLTIYGDGLQSRDFVSVDDVVGAIRKASVLPQRFGIFNVGSGRPTTVLDLATQIKAATTSASPVVHAAARANEVRQSWADTRLAELELGFKAIVGLDDGLAALARR